MAKVLMHALQFGTVVGAASGVMIHFNPVPSRNNKAESVLVDEGDVAAIEKEGIAERASLKETREALADQAQGTAAPFTLAVSPEAEDRHKRAARADRENEDGAATANESMSTVAHYPPGPTPLTGDVDHDAAPAPGADDKPVEKPKAEKEAAPKPAPRRAAAPAPGRAAPARGTRAATKAAAPASSPANTEAKTAIDAAKDAATGTDHDAAPAGA